MSTAMQILLKYPSLLPKNRGNAQFFGYINVHGIDYEIDLQRINGKIVVSSNSTLSSFQQDLEDLGETHTDILPFLNALHETIAMRTPTLVTANISDLYRRTLTEYMEFCEFYINTRQCSISPDLSEVRVTACDEYNRLFNVSIKVDYEHGGFFQVVRHDLPDKEELAVPSTSLISVYEKFLRAIEQLQPFFDTMQRFDSSCWILDPEVPTTKDAYRRIALDQNISMVVTVNPWNCNNIPNLQFLGLEQLVQDFRLKVATNLPSWDLQSNAFDELLKILEIDSFPMNQPEECKDVLLYNAGDCCICFSLRLDGNLPEIICENCKQFFHTNCLSQWLMSIGAIAKQTFNELHGECPNCEKHISCPAT